MIPIVFEHDGSQYVGWQMRGTLPMLFDCEYHELFIPDTKIQIPSSSNNMKPDNGYDNEQPVHEVSVESFAMGRY